jgi:hypothetical protein
MYNVYCLDELDSAYMRGTLTGKLAMIGKKRLFDAPCRQGIRGPQELVEGTTFSEIDQGTILTSDIAA